MLTYDFSNSKGPIYKQLYNFIKRDIISGILNPNSKLPSKRMLAANLGVSTISIENAYDQLISEGYIYTIPKKGYFVSELPQIKQDFSIKSNKKTEIKIPEIDNDIVFDFSSNRIESSNFPF